ncbi:hypothetical protein QM467_00640 [Rhodoblastus sp. 17X3]|uniref:hypothetical protein n=1 Tax=Rhodoblastus sp. 17X3 TaxID=3047026 RepID=UPI0024B7A088|nr:hypothetical protein [Rhodoblastus sp. 17X3]MDI9846558.1 hypothetical protein [Rhodoblastus sp. 17X3]
MSARFHVYGRLRKVEEDDDGLLHITGIASTEEVDRSGEIVLASAIRKAIPDFMAHGTGALRSMHGLDAAGKVDHVEIDDKNRTLIEATVVDPVAIKKVQTGVLKGLSIGGKVLGRDPKNSKIITKIAWSELSLVDRPANPEAVLDLWKADGPVDYRRIDPRDADFRKAEALLAQADDLLSKVEDLNRRLGNVEQFDKVWREANARSASVRGRPESDWRQ